MRELFRFVIRFFHGWKRKIGVLTLLFACVFVAGWVRSGMMHDFICLGGNKTSFNIGSMGGHLKCFWKTTTPISQSQMSWQCGPLANIMGYRIGADGKREYHDHWENYDVEWRYDFAGFHFGAGVLPTDGVRITVRIVAYEFPFWSIVTPFTALSAWLLFSKPGRSSQRKIPKPTRNE